MADELDVIASIRKRPGMYVGDVHDRSGTHHLVWEVLANAIDEHFAGRCTRIDVTLHADGSISVRDDGAGISFERGDDGVSWLERVLTTLHDTPTADGHAPHVHLGRFAVSLCMVSALSCAFSAEIRRDGRVARIELKRGRVTQELAVTGRSEGTGTTVRFTPDDTIFAQPDFEVGTVARRVRELSSLLPGLTTSFTCEPREYGGELGIDDLLTAQHHGWRSHARAVTGEAKRGTTLARVAFEWRNWSEPTIAGYCNLEPTPEGSHIEGFHRGLADGLSRTDHEHVFEALAPGLNAVISVLVVDPQYHGPTRERLESGEARSVAREATAQAMREALEADPELARVIGDRLRRGTTSVF